MANPGFDESITSLSMFYRSNLISLMKIEYNIVLVNIRACYQIKIAIEMKRHLKIFQKMVYHLENEIR